MEYTDWVRKYGDWEEVFVCHCGEDKTPAKTMYEFRQYGTTPVCRKCGCKNWFSRVQRDVWENSEQALEDCKKKRKRLEAAGYAVGGPKELLGLSGEDLAVMGLGTSTYLPHERYLGIEVWEDCNGGK